MVPKYKRKIERQSLDERSMKAAIEAVKSGIEIRKASKIYAIPTTFLRRRRKGLNKRLKGSAKVLESFAVNVLGTISTLYSSLFGILL